MVKTIILKLAILKALTEKLWLRGGVREKKASLMNKIAYQSFHWKNLNACFPVLF
jgi:hypothetical protein